jgi:CreA protein
MSKNWLCCATLSVAVVLWPQVVHVSYAADEPDLIFKRSTVFKLLTPNDKLATYGIDDPEVEGWRAISPSRSGEA